MRIKHTIKPIFCFSSLTQHLDTYNRKILGGRKGFCSCFVFPWEEKENWRGSGESWVHKTLNWEKAWGEALFSSQILIKNSRLGELSFVLVNFMRWVWFCVIAFPVELWVLWVQCMHDESKNWFGCCWLQHPLYALLDLRTRVLVWNGYGWF